MQYLHTPMGIEKEHNDKLRMTGGYESACKPADFECNVCGHEWATIPFDVFRGKGCSKCAFKKQSELRRTKEEDVHIRIEKEGLRKNTTTNYE